MIILSRLILCQLSTKKAKEMKIEKNRELQVSKSEEEVDLTLIRWMLSLTPEERLRTLENNIWSLLRLKSGILQT